MPGTTTLAAEVANVSGHCVWMLINDEELALPYSEFPWFKAATIQQILNVLRPTSPSARKVDASPSRPLFHQGA
jgi:hypothetical protein